MRSLREFLKFLAKIFRRSRPEKVVETRCEEEPSETGNLDQEEAILKTKEEGKSLTQSALREDLSRLKREDHHPAPIWRPRRKVTIQVGLDFGTSYTKIVYLPLIGRRMFRPVIFDHGLEICPRFCLPSVAAIDAKGGLLLGIEAARYLADKPWNSGLRLFKVLVAGKHDRKFRSDYTEELFYGYVGQKLGDYNALSPEQITAIYLAYAMNRSRQVIQGISEYRDCDIDLIFNVCVPIDYIQNNRVWPVFQHIIAWAEAIEREWTRQGESFDPLEFSGHIEGEVSYGEKSPGSFLREDPDARVFAVPESVAEVASYLVSMQRQEGIHAIIDFGAGTTDVSIFNLVGDAKSYWYSAGNIPRGTTNIEKIIADYLKENNPDLCTSEAVIEILQQLAPKGPRSQRSKQSLQPLMHKIRSELEDLWSSTHSIWGKAYNHCREESSWCDVQMFACGGGANLPYVDKVFSLPWWSKLREERGINYPVKNLPEPDDYDSANGKAPFYRMAVAYGLAQTVPELGEFVLPKDCPDQTPTLPAVKEFGISDGGSLKPTPGWTG